MRERGVRVCEQRQMRVCVLLAVDSLQLFDVTEEEKGARVIDVVSKRGVEVVVVTLLEYSSFFDSFSFVG